MGERVKQFGYSGALLSVLFMASVGVFFIPSWRAPLREFFAGPEREILSIDSGPILPDGDGRVVKLTTREGVLLEIYGPITGESMPLVDRILIGDRHDAFVEVRGGYTSLALKDMDDDRIFEIISPSYDSSLVPHLNIFRYNQSSGKFEPYVE